jgi:hypothetical protein
MNLQRAVNESGVSDPFIYFNDDFFVMRKQLRVPTYYYGSLLDHAMHYENRGGRSYAAIMRQTHSELVRLGIRRPRSYELHMPLVVHKEPMQRALDIARRAGHIGGRMLAKRSLYGNLADLGGRRANDVKVNGPGERIPGTTFLSTSDASWLHSAGEAVRLRFPTRGPYDPEDQHERRDALRAGHGGVVSLSGTAR